jgi:two-component system, chemotaxis family, sensor kinase Cph1
MALGKSKSFESFKEIAAHPPSDPESDSSWTLEPNTDITEQKRTKNALRESEERFRALVTASSDVVYRMSPDWSEMWLLQGKDFMADTTEPSRTWLDKYIHPDDQGIVLAAINEAIRTKTIFELEHRVWRVDGTLGWTFSRAIPLLDASGHIVEWFGAASDITKRKWAEQSFEESQNRLCELAERLDAEVRARTQQLEQRNSEVLSQAAELRDLSVRLMRTADQERRRVARELHDSAGQSLAALAMNLSQIIQRAQQYDPLLAKSAEEAEAIVQQLTRDIRTTSYLLHPPLLDENGLSAALAWYTEGLQKRSGLQIQLTISDEVGRLPSDMELLVFRVVQECLTNIHRHSGSKSAAIRIDRRPEDITIHVQDQGHGIPPEKLTGIYGRGSGVGIRGMCERLRQFRGELTIDSDGSGTRISATIPIPKQDEFGATGK